MSTINEIPVEILSLLLKNLPMVDRVRCREISKKFKYVIDASNREMVIGEIRHTKWFDDFKRIDKRVQIFHNNYVDQFEGKNYFRSTFFLHVRKLYVDLSNEWNSRYSPSDQSPKQPKPKRPRLHLKTFHFLNEFTGLMTLHLHLIAYPSSPKLFADKTYREVTKLSFPLLENLEINIGSEYIRVHFINSPNLQNLNFIDFKGFEFDRPQTIKSIQTILNENNLKRIAQCTKCERLRFRSNQGHINKLIKTIKQLPELKELEISPFDTDISNLQQYAKERPSLRVYAHGILLRYWTELPAFYRSGKFYGNLDDGNLKVYLKYFQSTVDDFHFIELIHYNFWESQWLANSKLIDNLEKKIHYVSNIKVNGPVKNFNYFLKFASKLDNLFALSFINTGFKAKFYESFNYFFPTAINLKIEDDPTIMQTIDLNFLFKRRYVTSFSTNHELELEFVSRLFLEKKLHVLSFQLEGERVHLRRSVIKLSHFTPPTNERLQEHLENLSAQFYSKYKEKAYFEQQTNNQPKLNIQ